MIFGKKMGDNDIVCQHWALKQDIEIQTIDGKLNMITLLENLKINQEILSD